MPTFSPISLNSFVSVPASVDHLCDESVIEYGRMQGIVEPKSHDHRQNEHPWNTRAFKLLAMGMSRKEVCMTVDKSSNDLSALMKMPWAQERLIQEIDKENAGLSQFFKRAAVGAAMTLVELLENPQTPASVRKSACDSILDRHLGKATNFVEVKTESVFSNPVESNKQLEAEILRLREAQNSGKN